MLPLSELRQLLPAGVRQAGQEPVLAEPLALALAPELAEPSELPLPLPSPWPEALLLAHRESPGDLSMYSDERICNVLDIAFRCRIRTDLEFASAYLDAPETIGKERGG